MNEYIELKQEDFQSAVEFFKKDISSLRVGRANPAVLEGVQVDAYGVKNAINGLANIAVNDSKSMTITPWDKTVLKSIEKAIVDANLGLGVVNEGDKIRINIPEMTEEKRKEIIKKLNEKLEHSRIVVRKIRDEVKETIEKAEKDKEISEDDKFRFIKELDEKVREMNEEFKEIRDVKEKDIMTI